MKKLFNRVEKESYDRLELVKKAQKKVDKSSGREPAQPRKTRGRARQSSKPELTDEEKQIFDMNDSIRPRR